jgi:hypothetical protein
MMRLLVNQNRFNSFEFIGKKLIYICSSACLEIITQVFYFIFSSLEKKMSGKGKRSRSKSSSRKSNSKSKSKSSSKSLESRSRSRSPQLNSRDAESVRKNIKAFKKDLRVYKKNFNYLSQAARLIYPQANLPDFGDVSPSPPPSPDSPKRRQRRVPKERKGGRSKDVSDIKAFDNWIKNAKKHRGWIKSMGEVEFKALKLELKNVFPQIRSSWKSQETQTLVKQYLCDTDILTKVGRKKLLGGCGSESDEESPRNGVLNI